MVFYVITCLNVGSSQASGASLGLTQCAQGAPEPAGYHQQVLFPILSWPYSVFVFFSQGLVYGVPPPNVSYARASPGFSPQASFLIVVL